MMQTNEEQTMNNDQSMAQVPPQIPMDYQNTDQQMINQPMQQAEQYAQSQMMPQEYPEQQMMQQPVQQVGQYAQPQMMPQEYPEQQMMQQPVQQVEQYVQPQMMSQQLQQPAPEEAVVQTEMPNLVVPEQEAVQAVNVAPNINLSNKLDTVKTVFFLMNGFGLEASTSFNVYSEATMPSIAKLTSYYPFAGLFAKGVEVGLNRGQLSSFKQGYLAFSCDGNPNRSSCIVSKKMKEGEFEKNPVIIAAVNNAVQNESRMHIMFNIGERTDMGRFEQLKYFGQLCAKNGVKDICVHVFLGDNSVQGLKVSAGWLKTLKYNVVNLVEPMRIVSIAGKKYLEDATKAEKVEYYRMIVSGVGEIWPNYEDTLEKKYEYKSDDNNMKGFLAVRENVLRAKDTVFFFNYDNDIGADYSDIIQNPTIYFPAGGKIPLDVQVLSLFEIYGNENVPYAFSSELPDNYFFKNISDERKILIIADSDRIEYISTCLNGFRKEFKPNVNVWPIENKKKRFEQLARYLSAYIDKDYYDLIIADCELFNEKVDGDNIASLKKNMMFLDRCLNVAYTKSIEKDYTLYGTSLYGIKARLLLTKTYENIDFSEKVPFFIAGKTISKKELTLPIDGNFTQVAYVIQRNMGVDVASTLVNKKTGLSRKKIYIAMGVIILAFIIFVIYAMSVL